MIGVMDEWTWVEPWPPDSHGLTAGGPLGEAGRRATGECWVATHGAPVVVEYELTDPAPKGKVEALDTSAKNRRREVEWLTPIASDDPLTSCAATHMISDYRCVVPPRTNLRALLFMPLTGEEGDTTRVGIQKRPRNT
jgi:hypothetical protein